MTDGAFALLVEAEALAWEAERRRLARPDFGGWLARRRRDMRWDYRHMLAMQASFNALTAGDSLRLLLQISGRHGKTEHVTSYGAYTLDLRPTTRVLFVTHSDDQARDQSDKVQRMTRAAGVALDAGRDKLSHWYTQAGGHFQAVGIGASTASINADLILIDDPIGKRAQAESQAERERVWLALTTDIIARAEPQTRIVFSMPRWHKDDPAGRLQTHHAGRWHVVDMPGRSLGDGDGLGRPEGAVLWPEMRDEKWHDGALIELGSYGYASFIQCRPSPRGGGMFKWDWWQVIKEQPRGINLVRYWDTAGTDTTGDNDPDWTAGVLGGRMADQRTVICDVARFRLSLAARDAKMEEVARMDLEHYGHRVQWWIETESGIGGRDRTSQLIRRLQNTGLNVHADPRPSKGKTERAEPFASKAEAGNVLLVEGDWNDPFRLEANHFPNDAHDDQVDAACGMDSKLANRHTTILTHVRQ